MTALADLGLVEAADAVGRRRRTRRSPRASPPAVCTASPSPTRTCTTRRAGPARAARRAGLRLDDLMLAQMLEGAPHALGMAERLRRDHELGHEPANIFSFPPSRMVD